jgi:peptidoglycan/LPS O-acetylase OafA/YrhL
MSSATAPETRRRSWATFTHRPAIDGVRAIAALLVIVFHAGMPGMSNGFAGVDVFFVLSGFLITSLIVRELWSRRRLDLPQFYARRVRRLLPAALTVLVITAVLYEFIASPIDVLDNRMSFAFAAVYVSNWYFLGQSQDYFAADVSPSPVLHYWSLSVEEQFYIVWPIIAILLLVGLRKRPLWAVGALGALTVAGAALAGWTASWSPMLSYFGTYNRAYQLFLGGTFALAILWREQREESGGPVAKPPAWRRPATVLAAVSLALLILISTDLVGTWTPYWVGLISCIATIGILAGTEYAAGSYVAKGLSARIPTLLGKYSYSMYLWHWPVIVLGGILFFDAANPKDWPIPWFVAVPTIIAVTIALAAATWWLVEGRAMSVALTNLKQKRNVIFAGLAGAVVVAVLAPVVLHVNSSVAQVISQVRDQTVTDIPLPTAKPTPSGTAQPTPVSKVLLVGDSHALMLIAAMQDLAEREGFEFATVTRAACPWPEIKVTSPDNGDELDCQALLRDPALDAAKTFRPDITLLVSGSVIIRGLIIDGNTVRPNAPGWLEAMESGSASFLFKLAEYSKNVVVLDPIPRTADDMVRCLVDGGTADSCASPAPAFPGESDLTAMWQRITQRPGLAAVTLDDLLCPGGVCPATYNGIVTRRDNQHLAEDYAMAIIDQIDAAFKKQGVDLQAGTVTKAKGATTS